MLNRDRLFWVKLSGVVNLIVTLYGVGIILYCLWFLKTWQEKTVGLPFSATPLFIHICLAIGIALCLGTTCGCVVANWFSDWMLSIYIVIICCLVALEIAVVVIIFITMDWVAKVNEIIDTKHSEFRIFILFHVCMCRVILLVSLVPQITAIALAIGLLALGTQAARSGCGNPSVIPDFRQSFLVLRSSRVHEESTHQL
ncbi:tetraspanin-19-like [Prosopis cineraria]|uniref:tetraspanin-19-like n=1 Tax=Prosopis cineraria TaxID=364024 RepID=UPI00240EB6EE|nr:tetraspanin-19-like [Prosopis cineraria]